MEIGSNTLAVVTGAAGGIGRHVAAELSRRGASLALLDVDRAELETIASRLANCAVYECDITDWGAVEQLSRAIMFAQGDAQVLINCAGVSVAGAVEALPLEQFERCLAVNFWGLVHACRAFLPGLRVAAQRFRSAGICNVLSDFALISLPTKGAYAASKYAARALTEALAAELHSTGITVTAAFIGATATDFVRRGYSVDVEKQEREVDFLARGMKPAFVAKRIVRAVERGRNRVLVGADARLLDAATRLSPNLFQLATRYFWRRVPFL